MDAIVLRVTPFRERDKIATLFTRERGLISLIAFGANSKKNRQKSLLEPLVRGDFVLKEGRGELLQLVEGKIEEAYLSLRKEYQLLDYAGKMARALLESQEKEKPAPQLYDLFTFMLDQLPAVPSPDLLYRSFLLRLMRHEGLLNLRNLPFSCTEEELNALEKLTHSQKMSELFSVSLSKDLKGKVEGLFHQLTQV